MKEMADPQYRRSSGGREFRPEGNYYLAVFMSWLVPGAGHWLMGHRVRGCILGFLLIGTFWWGEAMAGGYAVKRNEHPYFFIGQIGNGLSALVANKIEFKKLFPISSSSIDRTIPPGLTTGILLTSVSGLLNILLVLYVMDPRSWLPRELQEDRKP